jgi:hypothetical protein
LTTPVYGSDRRHDDDASEREKHSAQKKRAARTRPVFLSDVPDVPDLPDLPDLPGVRDL